MEGLVFSSEGACTFGYRRPRKETSPIRKRSAGIISGLLCLTSRSSSTFSSFHSLNVSARSVEGRTDSRYFQDFAAPCCRARCLISTTNSLSTSRSGLSNSQSSSRLQHRHMVSISTSLRKVYLQRHLRYSTGIMLRIWTLRDLELRRSRICTTMAGLRSCSTRFPKSHAFSDCFAMDV